MNDGTNRVSVSPALHTYDEREIKEFINIIVCSGKTDKTMLQYSEQADLKNRLLDSLKEKDTT